jgi:hypothetical protein
MSSANRLLVVVPRFLREVLQRLRDFHANQVELHERALLRSSPWFEDFLHWSFDGEEWQLHGHLPPPGGRVRSVTADGWCPALGRSEPASRVACRRRS